MKWIEMLLVSAFLACVIGLGLGAVVAITTLDLTHLFGFWPRLICSGLTFIFFMMLAYDELQPKDHEK